MVFVTTQHIGLTSRMTLEGLASEKGKLCILYHRERIRALLDSPTRYGVRVEYLRLSMSEAEQLAYFAASGNKLEYAWSAIREKYGISHGRSTVYAPGRTMLRKQWQS